jgi:hypothetical protein
MKDGRFLVCVDAAVTISIIDTRQEGQTGVIEWKDDEPKAAHGVLQFLYRRHYKFEPPAEVSTFS